MQYLAQQVAERAINAQLPHARKPEVEIWGNRINELAVPDFLFNLNTIHEPVFHHLAVKTTSGFGKTRNSIGEPRLTSL